MENTIVVYSSRYGATRRYAEELAKRLQVKAVDYRKANLSYQYDSIIYLGAMYAGGVKGLKDTMKKLSDVSQTNIMVITVGITDPTNLENQESIRKAIKEQMSPKVFAKMQIFHLRGAIDYKRFKLLDKLLMRTVYKKVSKMPEEERTPQIRALMETYGQTVDFVDFSRLDKIIAQINKNV